MHNIAELLTQLNANAPIKLNFEKLLKDPEYRNQTFREILHTDHTNSIRLILRIQLLEDQLEQIFMCDILPQAHQGH